MPSVLPELPLVHAYASRSDVVRTAHRIATAPQAHAQQAASLDAASATPVHPRVDRSHRECSNCTIDFDYAL